MLGAIGLAEIGLGAAALALSIGDDQEGLGEGFVGTAGIVAIGFGALFTTVGAVLLGLGISRRSRCDGTSSRLPAVALGVGPNRSEWTLSMAWRI